jgi:cytidylate kinase
VAYQREIGLAGGVVMEGRDIGTVVLPDAEVKVFLTASLEERARRRYVELEQKGTVGLTLKRVRAEIAERDERDSTRAISPLMPASDAVVIDSEALTARQVVETILDLCSARRKSASANRDRLP